jgi:FKBP-type peptidyl-prolyl cis-trans isomerase
MRIVLFTLMLAACGTSTVEETPPQETSTNKSTPEDNVSFKPPSDVAAPPADATITASGLAYKVLKAGTGEKHPDAQNEVEVHYTGWQTDGTMFDSSHKRGETIKFPLTRVIAGWTEGVQLMVEGEKARFWIPEDLAYKGRSGAPSGMLVFDIDLVKIVPSLSERFPAPDDVAAPPSDAKFTSSGLAYKVVKAGTGSTHPTAEDRVQVHYTGWTTDGETFDSSYKKGRPSTFPLRAVIAGWTEGIPLMVKGEQTRFWIPEESAYGGKKGRPQGMLVFDIELLEVMSNP